MHSYLVLYEEFTQIKLLPHCQISIHSIIQECRNLIRIKRLCFITRISKSKPSFHISHLCVYSISRRFQISKICVILVTDKSFIYSSEMNRICVTLSFEKRKVTIINTQDLLIILIRLFLFLILFITKSIPRLLYYSTLLKIWGGQELY